VPDYEPTITAGTRVTITYNAIDFKTLVEKRQYRVKIGKYANEQMSKQDEEDNGRKGWMDGWKNGRNTIRNAQYATRITHHASRFTFEVIDTGVGIPPEAQEEIFEPFTQGEGGIHIGGTGLGLAISKKQIELMGGELSLKSEPGVGSRFFFTIPLKPAASDVPVQSSRWNAVRRLAEGYAVKALVADDTKVNRDVLSQILSDIGVEVIEAENGQEALERVGISQPDIAFMDIRMPVMDGIEATRQILGRYGASGPKLVAVSASALIHERHRYFEAGFNDFIAKPIRTERVYECLANLLHVAYEYDADEPEIDLSKMSCHQISFCV